MKIFSDTRIKRRIGEIGHFTANVASAAGDFPNFLKGVGRTARLRQNLRRLANDDLATIPGKVPNVFHFVWGFCGQDEDFPFFAFMAIASALHFNPGWQAVFHFEREPRGPHWDRIKPRLRLNKVEPFSYFGIARLRHYAHKADIVRILALYEIGGVYLDCDTLTLNSFAPLTNCEFALGVQASIYGTHPGLCNATMISARNARFAKRWIRHYATFASKGRDHLWDYHSVRLPALLSFYHPDEITVLPADSFFYPLWIDLEQLVLEKGSSKFVTFLKDQYSIHLWNSTFPKETLGKIDETYVKDVDSLYSHYARIVLESHA